MSETEDYPQLPWIAEPNPMRKDGWFIRRDMPEIPYATMRLGRFGPERHMQPRPGVLNFQVPEPTAKFIVEACNSYHGNMKRIEELEAENARLRGLLEECKPMLKGYAALHVDKLNLLPWTVFDKDGKAANDLLERMGDA